MMERKKTFIYYGIVFVMLCLAVIVAFKGDVFAEGKAYESYVGGKGCALVFVKEWDDGDNVSGRPEEITFKANLQNATSTGVATQHSITLKKEDGWTNTYKGDEFTSYGYMPDSLKEVTPVEGYTFAGETIKFIGDDGEEKFKPTSGGIVLVTLKNKKENTAPSDTGSLVVFKNTDGNAGEKEKAFNFTVTLKDNTINGEYGEMNFENGVAEFTLQDAQAKVATNLPAGTEYTVTEAEANQDGYQTSQYNDKGKITKDNSQIVVFSNIRETFLTISKTVRGSEADRYTPFNFQVTLNSSVNGDYNGVQFTNGVANFTLSHGSSITIGGLPAGTKYTVTETEENKDGYTNTKTGDTGTIAYGRDNTQEAKFVNTRGNLVEVTSAQLGINGIKTLKGREFKTGDQFKFEIRNDDNKEQPLPDQAECVIQPTSGHTANIDFGTFTFEKEGTYTYIISEYQPQHAGTEIIPGMTYDPTGYRLTVKVEEDAQSSGGLKISNVKIEKSLRQEVGTWETVYDGAQPPDKQYCNFTNICAQEQTVSLTGTKVLENKKLSDYGDNQFKFILKAVGKKQADGGYQVVPEQPMPTGSVDGTYTLKNLITGGIVVPGITFTTAHAGNEYRYTIAEWQPTENGEYGGKPLEGAAKNSQGKWVYQGVTFDNHIHTVDAKVELVEDNGPKVKVAISHDAHGTGEGAMKNFIFTNVYHSSGGGGEITPPHPTTGSLTVFNKVIGNAADPQKDFHFTVTLNSAARDMGINGLYGDMNFKNGVAGFTLKHGEHKTATGLPTGIGYTVVETDANTDGYTTTSTGETGRIMAYTEAKAEFTNTKNEEVIDPDPEKPEKPTDPDSGKPEKPEKPTKPTKPTNPDSENPEKPADSDSQNLNPAEPKTGDGSNLPLWLILLGISGIGAVMTMSASGRKHKE